MKSIPLAISCILFFAAACTPQPTPDSIQTPQPTRTVIPSSTPTRIRPSPTRAALQPTAARNATPTLTATTVPPSPTRTRIPRTQLPTETSAPQPPPRPLVWDPRLDALNIQYVPAEVAPGQLYWRLTHAEFWGEEENQGKNHIFVNVLDENGVRLIGETITIEWLDGQEIITTEEKPAPEYSANVLKSPASPSLDSNAISCERTPRRTFARFLFSLNVPCPFSPWCRK